MRIPESEEKLDNTDIHPEQYELAKFVIAELWDGDFITFFENNKSKILELYPDANEETLEFIINSYKNAGIEKRTISTHKKATAGGYVDAKEWDIVEGIVKNVVPFGAFVDVGLKQDGLVHISQIWDKYVKDAKEIFEVGQDVRVKILWIDEKTWRISLGMKGI